MDQTEQSILNILIKESYISSQEAQAATDAIKTHPQSLIDYLLNNGIINKPLLGQAIAESFNLPFTDLTLSQPSQELVAKIPQEVAKALYIVLVSEELNKITIATSNPKNEHLQVELRKLFPTQQIILTYSFPKDIETQFIHYRDTLTNRLSHLLNDQTGYAPDIFEEILKESLIQRSSDIHFEPQEMDIVIRFRIDGVLHKAGTLPKMVYGNILNRVKVLAHLRIDEHNSPQDGAIRINKPSMETDLRVSIIPTLDGEKIVIRILAKYIEEFSLSSLGLSSHNQALLLEASKKPFGMALVTGPTGSGKTTTLYALLRLLNKPEVNITTIEDPVEYKIPGANQIQVNEQTKLTFATGLKSIVRQDPNIILVGEIRDLETMEIAINAALTGHLLFSTFHANDASTAIPRLLEMGAEPFLLSSTLNLIIAQRLVRKICNSCKFSQSYPKNYLAQAFPNLAPYFTEEVMTLYRGKGCGNCGGTGYKGRLAIYEFIKISPAMQDLIITHPSGKQIWEQAKKEGAVSLFEDGFFKVKDGVTTLEELLRVAQPN